MTKNKQVIMGEKKYKKELARKRKVKEKIKLSEEQMDTAMDNIGRLEDKRRESVNKYLEENEFTRPEAEDKEDKWRAIYFLKKTKYILEKVNLSENMTKALGDDMAKLSWLYQITDVKTRKKWQIFQVNFLEKTNNFKIVKLMDGKDIKPKKK